MILSPNASTVSRQLHAAGFRPLPSGTSRMREGLRVSQSGQAVSIAADLDSDRQAERLADEVAECLRNLDGIAPAYKVERTSANIVRVSR